MKQDTADEVLFSGLMYINSDPMAHRIPQKTLNQSKMMNL